MTNITNQEIILIRNSLAFGFDLCFCACLAVRFGPAFIFEALSSIGLELLGRFEADSCLL